MEFKNYKKVTFVILLMYLIFEILGFIITRNLIFMFGMGSITALILIFISYFIIYKGVKK
jgi:hypothetical protein